MVLPCVFMDEKIFNFKLPGPRWIWLFNPQIESVTVKDQGISIKLGAKCFDFVWPEIDKLLYTEDWISYDNSSPQSCYQIVTAKGEFFTLPFGKEKYQLILELKKYLRYEEKIHKTINARILVWGLFLMLLVFGVAPLIFAVFTR